MYMWYVYILDQCSKACLPGRKAMATPNTWLLYLLFFPWYQGPGHFVNVSVNFKNVPIFKHRFIFRESLAKVLLKPWRKTAWLLCRRWVLQFGRGSVRTGRWRWARTTILYTDIWSTSYYWSNRTNNARPAIFEVVKFEDSQILWCVWNDFRIALGHLISQFFVPLFSTLRSALAARIVQRREAGYAPENGYL